MTSNAALCQPLYVTEHGIPIKNLWYMLMYVWNAHNLKGRWHGEIEKAPTLDALLTTILALLFQQRLRIGLGRDYREEGKEIYGIRGRVDFNESLKRLTMPHGRTFSRYQIFNANVPKNQIIRSILNRLVQVGDFGDDIKAAQELRHRLRKLSLELEGIDIIELKPTLIRREQLKQQDSDYNLMLSICYLLFQRQMPRDKYGDQILLELDRESLTLSNIFEKFVAAFYKRKLASEWEVWPQQTLRWPSQIESAYLPVMNPDLTLRNLTTGELIILDTKFTASCLVKGRWGNLTFDRNHIFQIYSYLKSQEDSSNEHKSATGILLYPTAQYCLHEKVNIQGHEIRWDTIDLADDWENIEMNLLSIIHSVKLDHQE